MILDMLRPAFSIQSLVKNSPLNSDSSYLLEPWATSKPIVTSMIEPKV